jgi:class 3 adenylate cyclase
VINKIVNNRDQYQKALLLGFFLFLLFSELSVYSQNTNDSLKQLYHSEKNEIRQLDLLTEILNEEYNSDSIKAYANELLKKASVKDSSRYRFTAYLKTGNADFDLGNYPEALQSYFDAAEVAINNSYNTKNQNSELDRARINIAIADVYSVMENSETAIKYYRESIKRLSDLNEVYDVATAELNLGYEYYNQKVFDSSLYYYEESKNAFLKLEGTEYEVAYCNGNQGLVYAEMGNVKEAEKTLNEAIDILTTYQDYLSISEFLNGISDVYFKKKKYSRSLKYAKQSLKIASENEKNEILSESYFRLSNIYNKTGNYKNAFLNYQSGITIRDSIKNIEDAKEISDTEKRLAIELKQKEVDLSNAKAETAEAEAEVSEAKAKNSLYITIGTVIFLFLIGILAYNLFKRNKFMKKTNAIIESEKQRSDNLLTNILPDETAQELKDKGSVTAKKYESVSVLFTDFKGFTAYSEKLSPEELVKSIDYYFSEFDRIIEENGLEKIKTVGDAYMCACGLPYKDKDHAYKITKAAHAIAKCVEETKAIENDKLAKFDIRIGINSGPVVSGVVGTKKFAYDIWGDTVNTASRMESSSEIGRVNISQSTYEHIKKYPEFSFERRGDIEAKGKGKIAMYFVNLT